MLAGRSANRHNLSVLRRVSATGGTAGMHIVLMALGVIVALAGGGMTVFGVANNAFDIGNTMISAGMTGLVGGLIIVALANVARELRAPRPPQVRAPSRPAPAAAPAPAREPPAEKPPPAPVGP